eukprot:scaffold21891_cov63-Phaeocystis_antarctica.AAC.2
MEEGGWRRKDMGEEVWHCPPLPPITNVTNAQSTTSNPPLPPPKLRLLRSALTRLADENHGQRHPERGRPEEEGHPRLQG